METFSPCRAKIIYWKFETVVIYITVKCAAATLIVAIPNRQENTSAIKLSKSSAKAIIINPKCPLRRHRLFII